MKISEDFDYASSVLWCIMLTLYTYVLLYTTDYETGQA